MEVEVEAYPRVIVAVIQDEIIAAAAEKGTIKRSIITANRKLSPFRFFTVFHPSSFVTDHIA